MEPLPCPHRVPWEAPGKGQELNGTGGFQTDDATTGPGTYDLIYWYEDPTTGCRDTVDHVVTVQEIPTVDAGADTTFCNQPIDGTLLNFSPGLTQGGTGSWSGLGAFAPSVSPDGTVDPSVSGAGSFTAVYTFTANTTGCTNTASIAVDIAEPLVADAGPDLVACDNAFPLQPSGFFPTADIDWAGTSPGAAAGLLDPATGLLSPGILPPGTYTYLLSYGIGTCYTEDEMELTIDPLPVLDLASPTPSATTSAPSP